MYRVVDNRPFLLVSADGFSPHITLFDLLQNDPDELYSGNADIDEWLKSKTLGGKAEERQLGILALPLGFVFGSAIASALTRTTTTTTQSTTTIVSNP